MKKITKVKIQKAMTFWDKVRGLMFKKNIKPIYLETRWGIHTFFVREPLLVFVLDDDCVVCRKKKIDPWRMFFWHPKNRHVLEFPADSQIAQGLKIGDRIDLDFV